MEHLKTGHYEFIKSRRQYVARFGKAPPSSVIFTDDPVDAPPEFVAIVDGVLAELAKRPPKAPPPPPVDTTPLSGRRILEAVAAAWRVPMQELRIPKRTRSHAYPRFAAMLIMRDLLGWSSSMVGKALGGRDHTTCLAGFKRATGLIANDPKYAERYHAALALLSNSAGGVR